MLFWCRNMNIKIPLVFCYVTMVIWGEMDAASKTDDKENCIVSLVIPQEKIKSTCDEKGKTTMKMHAIASEIRQVQRDISELNIRLTKLLAKDDHSQEIKQLSERLEKLENNKIPSIEGRLTLLEEDKQRGTFKITRKRLVRVLKPLVDKELDDIKNNLAAEIKKQLDAATNSLLDSSYEEITSEILYNQLQSNTRQRPPSPQPLRTRHPKVTKKSGGKHSTQFSRRFDQQLERLAQQFQYESDQSALDNEVPENGVPSHFFQADGRFDSRMDRLIEIFKSELAENLDKQTEKVKSITNRHLKEIERKMIKVLDIIEGFRTKYENKLFNMSKHGHHERNASKKIESLENDIKTLASGIASLRSNFLADPQFQDLLQQELLDMEFKMTSKFSDYTKPLRQEITDVHEKLDNSERQQHITKTALQNFKADMRQSLHYVENNISTLNQQYNETQYPDYPDFNQEDLEHDLKVSRAVHFIEGMKDNWQYVFPNISQLHQLHAKDIVSIKLDFVDAQSKYDQLKERHSDLLKQIDTIQNSMENFKESLEEVERYTRNSALEENKWIAYDFQYSAEITGCYGGKKYVKKTGYETGVFVGVILCNATRYKIFLSDSLEDTFLDIGDKEDLGEDHCEFVGASKQSVIKVNRVNNIFANVEGYYRESWGQTPIKGRLKIYIPSPSWYECGVTIPE